MTRHRLLVPGASAPWGNRPPDFPTGCRRPPRRGQQAKARGDSSGLQGGAGRAGGRVRPAPSAASRPRGRWHWPVPAVRGSCSRMITSLSLLFCRPGWDDRNRPRWGLGAPAPERPCQPGLSCSAWSRGQPGTSAAGAQPEGPRLGGLCAQQGCCRPSGQLWGRELPRPMSSSGSRVPCQERPPAGTAAGHPGGVTHRQWAPRVMAIPPHQGFLASGRSEPRARPGRTTASGS